MRTIRIAAAAGLAIATAGPQAQDWKPAPSPLMTRWAKDVSPDAPHPEYPRPQFVRDNWKNLNGLWEFAVAQPFEPPPIGRKLDREILVPFPVESALSGVGERASEVWYRRTFEVDDWLADGRRVLLNFGAVDWEARVWINGVFIGEHRGGYDAFSFDVTHALRPGGEQEIVVGVWDPSDQGFQPAGKQAVRPHGIWYTPSTGVWQTVWLEPVSPLRLDEIHFTPDVDESAVHVEVRTAGAPAPALAAVVVRDPAEGGRVVAGERIRIDPQTRAGRASIRIPDPKLWSPDSPFLYDVEATLEADAIQQDRVRSYFGVRKISLGKDEKGVTRIFLNNQELFQLGLLDQGFWPDGLYTAPTDEALRFDVETTKRLGFNMCRKHVKVEPERWYYWADRIGLLVWQDMPSGDQRVPPALADMRRAAQSARQFEQELDAMIRGRGNHPSIVAWVVFNEGWGQYDTKRLAEWTKARDPSRLVVAASGWNDRGVGDVHDLHNYPNPRSPKPEANRAAVNGEFGGLGLAVEGHTWQAKDNWGYQKLRTADELMDRYEELIDRVRVLKGDPGLSAAVYTQTTDVEIEVNGLMTYDRAMLKGDLYRYRAINLSVHKPAPVLSEIASNAHGKDAVWRYTLETPPPDWMQVDFDDSAWKSGEAGFGSLKAPNARVRTVWETPEIWLRRVVELPDRPLHKPFWTLHHDDDVEIYLNGRLAHKAEGWTTDYTYAPLSKEAFSLLKPGKNLLAVRCRQDAGEQYIDLGIVERTDP
jgi:hypothetical protein